MSPEKRKSPSLEEVCFKGMTRNAMDYLERSVSQFIAGDFKYSSAHLFNAAELLVKARLLKEHWSLIVSNVDQSNRDNFLSGKLKSVGLDESSSRLRKIVGEDIKDAARVFSALRERRNRAVHFFANEYPSTETTKKAAEQVVGTELLPEVPPVLLDVVAEQCAAWHELHRLIAERWRDEFKNIVFKFDQIHQRLLTEAKRYLEFRYETKKNEIDKAKHDGIVVAVCDACDCVASLQSEVVPGLFLFTCVVCNHRELEYHFSCPESGCSGNVVVRPDAGGECNACQHEMAVEEIIEHLEDYVDPKEGLRSDRAHCYLCLSLEVRGGTAIWVRNAQTYICFDCLASSDEVCECESCGLRYTGQLENSYFLGCEYCDGHFATGD